MAGLLRRLFGKEHPICFNEILKDETIRKDLLKIIPSEKKTQHAEEQAQFALHAICNQILFYLQSADEVGNTEASLDTTKMIFPFDGRYIDVIQTVFRKGLGVKVDSEVVAYKTKKIQTAKTWKELEEPVYKLSFSWERNNRFLKKSTL